jgi:hypothetical protein
MRLRLMSWLTLLNDNGQSFADAELMAVAGRLNVTSDYRSLADPPDATPLSLVCYPIGHTADGSPIDSLLPPPPTPPPPAAPLMESNSILVTAQRISRKAMDSGAAITAVQEDLGDLKLYRVPEPVTVSAKGLKQVAFLDKGSVRGKMIYQTDCSWREGNAEMRPAQMRFETVNDAKHGLGAALPTGAITFFEPSPQGGLFVGERQLRDYAQGQDVEIPLGDSAQVFATCARGGGDPAKGWAPLKASVTNANPHPVTLRIKLGTPRDWRLRGLKATRVKDGELVWELTIPANGSRELAWDIRRANSAG